MDNRRIRVLGTVLFVACLAVGFAKAGGAFAKEFESAAAVTEKATLSLMNGNGDGAESGRGPVPYLKKLGAPPKRVALVSFYVWDIGFKKENHYNPVYRYKITRDVNYQAVDAYANELYDASIAGFKEGFAAYGVQLLTADEFLDTPERKAAYEGFELQMNSLVKFLGKSQKGTKDNYRFSAAPEGYRLFQLVTVMNVKGNNFELGASGAGVGKLAHSLGHELATALGVDAVVIIYNPIQADDRSISMLGSYLYMFGPNPVPNTGQSLYWDGHQYSGVYVRMRVPFISTDKEGKLIESDYPGYAVIPQGLAAKMGEHLKEKASGTP